jgi:hypothetical protein
LTEQASGLLLDKPLMAAVRDDARKFFGELDPDDADATLRAVPDLVSRIPFPISGEKVVGIFYLTLEQAQRARGFEEMGLGPFPSLFTTNPTTFSAIDVQAPNFFFGRNRANGLALRIGAAATTTIWRHVQVLEYRGTDMTYPVDIGFVLGLTPGESIEPVRPRLLSLLQHTVNIWRGIDWRIDGTGQ